MDVDTPTLREAAAGCQVRARHLGCAPKIDFVGFRDVMHATSSKSGERAIGNALPEQHNIRCCWAAAGSCAIGELPPREAEPDRMPTELVASAT